MSLPSSSIVEDVQLNRLVIVPNALQGLFKRRAALVDATGRLGVDGAAIKFLAGLRNKHDGSPVWVHVVRDKQLLLLDAADVRTVLEGAPQPYASDPPAKKAGMGHFQPHALTLSRSPLWENRRQFTEAVLDTPQAVHPDGNAIVAIAQQEIAKATDGSEVKWDAWHAAFRRLTRRIILGDQAADDEELSTLLGDLMGEANRMPSERTDKFDAFMAALRKYTEASDPQGLAKHFAAAPHDADTAVSGQVPHWMFATGDTLATNTFRALALLGSHPAQRMQALTEIEQLDRADATALADAKYLRGCLNDAARLWPTTPMLSRETTEATTLRGETIPEGTQLLWSNLFFHRDRSTVDYADRFAPEEWLDGGDAADRWQFNAFSHGPQGCPGYNLAILIGTAVMAELLLTKTIRTRAPKLDPDKPLPASLDFFNARLALQ